MPSGPVTKGIKKSFIFQYTYTYKTLCSTFKNV